MSSERIDQIVATAVFKDSGLSDILLDDPDVMELMTALPYGAEYLDEIPPEIAAYMDEIEDEDDKLKVEGALAVKGKKIGLDFSSTVPDTEDEKRQIARNVRRLRRYGQWLMERHNQKQEVASTAGGQQPAVVAGEGGEGPSLMYAPFTEDARGDENVDQMMEVLGLNLEDLEFKRLLYEGCLLILTDPDQSWTRPLMEAMNELAEETGTNVAILRQALGKAMALKEDYDKSLKAESVPSYMHAPLSGPEMTAMTHGMSLRLKVQVRGEEKPRVIEVSVNKIMDDAIGNTGNVQVVDVETMTPELQRELWEVYKTDGESVEALMRRLKGKAMYRSAPYGLDGDADGERSWI